MAACQLGRAVNSFLLMLWGYQPMFSDVPLVLLFVCLRTTVSDRRFASHICVGFSSCIQTGSLDQTAQLCLLPLVTEETSG